jgi:hypothetical protein
MRVRGSAATDGLIRVDRRAARLAVARETERRCRSRVPYRTGRLMRSAVIAEDGSRLVYGVPYGKRVYYGVTPAGAALRFSGAPCVARTGCAGCWRRRRRTCAAPYRR